MSPGKVGVGGKPPAKHQRQGRGRAGAARGLKLVRRKSQAQWRKGGEIEEGRGKGERKEVREKTWWMAIMVNSVMMRVMGMKGTSGDGDEWVGEGDFENRDNVMTVARI